MGVSIKPICSESEYDAALAEIDTLFNAPNNTPEGERLEGLVTLVESYEETHHPIERPSPIEAILHHMERQELTCTDLEQYIGSRARVSEILNGKRPLSLKMIRRLQEGLGISAEILIQPYDLQKQ